MLRAEVNQGILDLFSNPSYLEIGVAHGETFHAVRAARKVAVDPAFVFDLDAARADPSNSKCTYHQVTSDIYFSDHQPLGEKFDVIFIDGLHTFDQTLKDLMNAILSVNEGGVIVVDDVIPASYQSSISDVGEFMRFLNAIGSMDGTWMGDVYRLVFFVEQYLSLFNYATVAENHGQMVMWRGRRSSTGAYVTKLKSICESQYMDVKLYEGKFNIKPLADIVNDLKTTLPLF